MKMRAVTSQELDRLSRDATTAQRRRANLNVHPDLGDPYQRFFNAMEPDTYVRPHRHGDPGRWELFIVIRGAALVHEMTADGRITERTVLAPDRGAVAVEIEGQRWHTVVALEPGTVLFEVKPGPYCPVEDKDFAAWAPDEGGTTVPKFVERMRSARVGDSVNPEH
jgi:cupin fold WbuC family metalloprotein